MINDDENIPSVSNSNLEKSDLKSESSNGEVIVESKSNHEDKSDVEVKCVKPSVSIPIIVEPISENGSQNNTNVSQVCDKVSNLSVNDEYPDDYNPFGDDDEYKEAAGADVTNTEIYPDDLNPFGDDSECNEPVTQSGFSNATVNTKSHNCYDNSLNPFGSDDEEETTQVKQSSLPVTPVPVPRRSLRGSTKSPLTPSVQSYSTSSLERTKKRPSVPPPRPPPPTTSDSNVSLKASVTNVSLDSENLSPSPVSSTPERTKKVLKKKPAPKPPGFNASINNNNDDNSNISIKSDIASDIISVESQSIPATPEMGRRTSSAISSPDHRDSMSPSVNSVSSTSENDCSLEATDDSILESPRYMSFWRNKKRKAPPIPIPMRVITKNSIEEIQKELNEIGDKLASNDKRTMEILEIMQKVGTSHKQRKLINEYLVLSHEKCSFAKKQEELMYLKREHKLEEDHADIEYKLRIIMAKPESMKSEEDGENEQQLLQRLVEIIEERNDIVENMMKIDKRIDFNILVDKVKQIKGESVVTPIFNNFMKNCYDESAVKASDIKRKVEKSRKSKSKNKSKVKNDKSEKSSKSALSSLKKIAKVK